MRYEDHTDKKWDKLIEEWHTGNSSLSLQEFLQLDNSNYTQMLYRLINVELTEANRKLGEKPPIHYNELTGLWEYNQRRE